MFRAMKAPAPQELPSRKQSAQQDIERAPPSEQALDLTANLSAEQVEALTLRAAGKDFAEVHDLTRISVARLRSWESTNNDYRFALNYLRAEVFQFALDGLRAGMNESVNLLRDTVADGSLPQSQRIKAAQTLLATAIRMGEVAGKGGSRGADDEGDPNQAVRRALELANAGDDDTLELLLALRERIRT